MTGGLFRREKSLSELEEETEHLEAENKKEGLVVSLARKRLMTSELKKRGLTPGHFSGNWSRIWQFLKEH